MLIETHKKITARVAEELGIRGRHRAVLVRAVRRPDTKTYRKRHAFSHHNSSALYRAKSLVLEARRLYLLGYYDECFRKLGEALHFIQDNCCPRFYNVKDHKMFERSMLDLEVPSEAIHKAMLSARRTREDFEELLKDLAFGNRGRDPGEALWLATYATARTILDVTGPREPPQELYEEYVRMKSQLKRVEEEYRRAKEGHRQYVKRAKRMLGLGAALSAVLSLLIFPLLGIISMALLISGLSISAVLAVKIVSSDAEYRAAVSRLKEARGLFLSFEKRLKEWYLLPSSRA